MPQGTMTTCDGPFSAKGFAVLRIRCQSSECGNLFAGDARGAPVSEHGHRRHPRLTDRYWRMLRSSAA